MRRRVRSASASRKKPEPTEECAALVPSDWACLEAVLRAACRLDSRKEGPSVVQPNEVMLAPFWLQHTSKCSATPLGARDPKEASVARFRGTFIFLRKHVMYTYLASLGSQVFDDVLCSCGHGHYDVVCEPRFPSV